MLQERWWKLGLTSKTSKAGDKVVAYLGLGVSENLIFLLFPS